MTGVEHPRTANGDGDSDRSRGRRIGRSQP